MGPKKSAPINGFAVLSLHEEQDPRKVLQLQSGRNQKKLQHQAMRQDSKANKQQQGKQAASSSHAASWQAGSGALSNSDSDGPGSPGLQQALAAIAAAEQQEAAALWQQQAVPAVPAAPAVAPPSLWQQPVPAAVTAAPAAASPSVQSLSTQGSVEGSGWPSLLDLQDASSDPWGSAPAPQQQQLGINRQQSARSCSHSPLHCLPQQQQQQQGEMGDHHSHHLTSSQAFNWRSFAMSFAEAARAAGDEDAADGALMFSASEQLAAVFDAAAGAAAVELEGVALQAAAAGLTAQELLQAQQEELLLQINRARQRRAGPNWCKATLDWGSGSSTGGLSSGHSSKCASPAPKPKCAPDVGCDEVFPKLESSSSSSSSAWQQVAPSPHAVPRGWKGGRQAAKSTKAPAKSIKLLHSPAAAAAGGGHQGQLQPSTLDLHWDLLLEGMTPLQRGSEEGLGGPTGGLQGPWGLGDASNKQVGVVRGLSCDGQAAERTRQLLSEQEEAAAAAGSRAGAGSSSNRDRLAADTVRSMLDKAASREARLATAAQGSTYSRQAAAAAEEQGEPEEASIGSKASFSYSWSNLFKTALEAGWQPVGKADGGGGSHFKLRRVLPLSGVTQTIVLPCTPSDSQRGVRNVAASFKKREDEKVLLEAQAAALQQAAGVAAGGKGASTRKK